MTNLSVGLTNATEVERRKSLDKEISELEGLLAYYDGEPLMSPEHGDYGFEKFRLFGRR